MGVNTAMDSFENSYHLMHIEFGVEISFLQEWTIQGTYYIEKINENISTV